MITSHFVVGCSEDTSQLSSQPPCPPLPRVSLERAHRERWRSVSELDQTGHLRGVYSSSSWRSRGPIIAHRLVFMWSQLFSFLNTGAKVN